MNLIIVNKKNGVVHCQHQTEVERRTDRIKVGNSLVFT